MAITAAPLLFGQIQAPPAAEEVEPVLLQPFLGKVPLTDAINALPTAKHGALVPLGELCRLLAFGIRIDVTQKRASGFFISEKRRFSLDLTTGRVEADKAVFQLAPGAAVFQNQDIYVEAARLQEWFPIELKVDLKAAVVMIRGKEKLPIQDEWARDRRYSALSNSVIDFDDLKPGEFVPVPYRFVDMPFVDLTAYWNRSQFSGSRPPQGAAVVAGDLLWMSANGYFVHAPKGETSTNAFTLSREDPLGGLLGPLHAKRMAAGTLMQPSSIPLVGSLPQGVGLTVENYPLAYRSKFASRTFRGMLLDGWSVEFFQNGALMAFQRSRPDGLYEFKDIPLRFGLNQFRLVFHGPLGQVREENARIDIGSEQPPPGVFYYRLLGVRPDAQNTSEMLPEDALKANALRRPAYLLEMDYGLSSVFALNASRSRVMLADGHHDYTLAGVSGMFSYLSAQVTGAQDRRADGKQGKAAEGIIRTGLGYSSLTVRRSEYRNGFEKADQSLLTGSQRLLRSETAVDLSATFDLGKTPIGTMLSRQADAFVAGGTSTKDRLQVSVNLPTLSLSQSFFRQADTSQTAPTSLQSTTLVSANREDFGLQGDVSFLRAAGKTTLAGWGAIADHRTASGLFFRGGVRGTSASLKDTTFLGMVTRMTGRIGYGVDAQYSKIAGYSLGIRLQAFFGREPRTRTWITDAQPQAGMGAVSAAAYLDTNGNGQRDPGERGLDGTQFKLYEATVESRVQDPRAVFITQLPKSQETFLRVDETSLEDAAQQSTVKGYRFIPRPGKVARLDFPVGYFGEITGTTRIRRAKGTAEYGGLEIELLKANGDRVKRIRTAYDGFFEFRDLPLGDYILQVTPEEVVRLKQLAPKPRLLHLDNVRNLFEGQDLTMESQPTAEPPGPEPRVSEPQVPTQIQGSVP